MVTAGTGFVTVNVVAAEAPPPGAGFTTVIWGVPPLASSDADTLICNCVALIKVVVLLVPFHCTTEVETKPVPVTVTVVALLPAGTEVGFVADTVGAGLLIASATALEVPPPGVGLLTVN